MKMLQKIIFVVLSIAPVALANCTDDQIQKYFASSANYHRIVQAVYPPARPSSLLIKVQVQFVNESSLNSTDECDVLHGKVGASENYTWSKQCLYVSGGLISLHTMRVFSLGTIWPERRQEDLCIRLPQKCRGDLAKEGKMTYFLSKLESVAVRPKAPDPRMNTVKCITRGHGKATFIGIKSCLGGVCWGILVAALGFSLLASWVAMLYLKQEFEHEAPKKDDPKDDREDIRIELVSKTEEDQQKDVIETAASATNSALTAVDNFTQTAGLIVGMKTAKAAIRAANKAVQAAKNKGTRPEALVKVAEAATKSEIVAKAVKVAAEKVQEAAAREQQESSNITGAADTIEHAPAASQEKLATCARVTAAAAKEATALAETTMREEITKVTRVSMMEAAVFLMWIYTVVEFGLIFTAFWYWDKDYCLIVYTVIAASLFVFSLSKCPSRERKCPSRECKCPSRECKCSSCINEQCEIVRERDVIVCPSAFIVIHHLLWVFLGMITEPYWALAMLLAICSVSLSLYYMACTYCQTFPGSDTKYNGYMVTAIVQFAVSSACLILFVIIITLVGRASFDESFVAASVQSVLLIILGIWSRQLSLN